MKELSIEEKAKAYDEAIERVVNIRTGKCETTFIFTEGLFNYLFPELEESNGEEVRKAMIDFFKHEREEGVVVSHYGVNIERMIAWLEKQGEHKKFRDSIQVGDEVTRNSDGVIVNMSQLKRVAKKDEKQGEQKQTDEDMKEALRTEYEKGRADAIAEIRKKWDDCRRRKDILSFLESLRLKED